MDAKQKKLIIIAAIIVMCAILGSLLFKYLSTGTVTVKTNGSGYYVRVVKTSGEKDEEIGKAQPINKSLGLRLKSGEYQIYVYGQSISANSNIVLKARQHQTVSLTPRKPLPTEAAYGHKVNSLVASNPQFVFINQSDGRLMSSETNGNVRVIDSGRTYSSARWASPDFGVAQSSDKYLYLVKNGSVSQLSLPFNPSVGEGVYYAVSPDKTIYVSHGNDVYQGSEGMNFKKIYSGSYNHLKLTASGDRVAVYYSGTEGEEEGTVRGKTPPQLTVIDSAGKVTGTLKGSEFFEGEWSADGKYLLLSEPTGISLFNNSLRKIVSIPTQDLGSFAWKNNGAGFFYGSGSDLWEYDIRGSSASMISTVSNGTIEAVYLDKNQTDIYISASDNNSVDDEGSLLRTKLNVKKASSLSALNVFMPGNVGVCYLDYVNLIKPLITVSYSATTTTTDFCINAARGDLKYYEVDPNQFTYITNPRPSE